MGVVLRGREYKRAEHPQMFTLHWGPMLLGPRHVQQALGPPRARHVQQAQGAAMSRVQCFLKGSRVIV